MKISGIVLWVAFALYLLLRVIYGKDWVYKVGVRGVLGSNLVASLEKLLGEFQIKNVSKETLAEVGAHVVWRITRIGLFAIIIAFIPFVLLFQQNRLISKQNDLFGHQHIRIDQQTTLDSLQAELLTIQNNLIEAERRSSLVFLMSNSLDQLDRELKSEEHKNGNISSGLKRRIIALGKSFRPYYSLAGDSLSTKLVSPERGQLLISITKSGINSASLQEISEQGDFSYAVIGDVDLSDLAMNQIKLENANLRDANLRDTDLSGARLIGANFWGADLRHAKNINYGALIEAKSLYKTRGITDSIKNKLFEVKPSLFDSVSKYHQDFH